MGSIFFLHFASRPGIRDLTAAVALGFVVGVGLSDPSNVALPSVVEVVPELSVAPVEVLAGAGAAGSAMWPTASR